MEILYFLIPISLVLLGIIVGIFLWSVKSGQFDDLEGPAHRILMQEEKRVPAEEPSSADDTTAGQDSKTKRSENASAKR